ncbi:MAG: tRNA lysidine(34) synthetase TilS [Alphaproteobacteria bacterium]|nr:tRNA lysidine(34) synthetase TilS [Alphaproteobacteria bacterium]
MFQDFLEKHNIKPQTLAVGVSGGADSLACVLILNDELSKKGYKIVALTVDHKLRPSSTDEAAYVKKIMLQNNIEHHILTWSGKKPSTGIEERARQARYNLICNWCQKNNVSYLITAHHLFDQAETFLMRLQRGSGLDGLCGMNELSKISNITILRPFLTTDPSVFKAYLKKRRISWIEDESNNDENLLRVRMRRFLPLLEEATDISPLKIVQTMQRLQNSRDYFSFKIQSLIQNNFKRWHEKAYSCQENFFLSQPQELQYRLICFLLQSISQAAYQPEAEKVLKLIEKMQSKTFKSSTLGHCQILSKNNQFWFLPEKVETGCYSPKYWKEYTKQHNLKKTDKIPASLKRLILNNN